MLIKNNIIKENLKNVYFICGNACAGKTTMAKELAKKYNLYLYQMDEEYPEHRRYADELNQPNMCYHLTDFHEQYSRPIEEQVKWNFESLKEQSEMVIVDLMRLSKNQIVVADVLFSELLSKDIIDYDHIIFLTVDKSFIRKCYFNRPEKRSFYDHVNSLELRDVYFENIFKNLEVTNEVEKELMKKSGFYMYERKETDKKEDIVKILEKHFKISNNAHLKK